jgi:hypothetical protein
VHLQTLFILTNAFEPQDFYIDYSLKLRWQISPESIDYYLLVLCKRQLLPAPYNATRLTLNKRDHISLFWTPELVIANAKKSSHGSAVVNGEMLAINFADLLDEHKRSVDMDYQETGKAVLRCSMKFYNYPVDLQHCYIELRSGKRCLVTF